MTREEMVDLIEKYVELFNVRSVDGVIAMYAEDAEITDPHGNLVKSKATIRKGLIPYFGNTQIEQTYKTLRADVDLEHNTIWSIWTMKLIAGGHESHHEGCDTFEFDEHGLIKRQAVYAQASMFAQ